MTNIEAGRVLRNAAGPPRVAAAVRFRSTASVRSGRPRRSWRQVVRRRRRWSRPRWPGGRAAGPVPPPAAHEAVTPPRRPRRARGVGAGGVWSSRARPVFDPDAALRPNRHSPCIAWTTPRPAAPPREDPPGLRRTDDGSAHIPAAVDVERLAGDVAVARPASPQARRSSAAPKRPTRNEIGLDYGMSATMAVSISASAIAFAVMPSFARSAA